MGRLVVFLGVDLDEVGDDEGGGEAYSELPDDVLLDCSAFG